MIKFCECGCGVEVKRRFVSGHNTRKAPKERILCLCGCGELANAGYRYIRGHQRRGSILTEAQKGLLRGKIPWNKGIPRTEQEKENIKNGVSEDGRKRRKEAFKNR